MPDPDSEGERILEYALAYDLLLKNRGSHLVTYMSGNTETQVGFFVLFRKSLHMLVMVVNVTTGEEVALQYQLLVSDLLINMPPQNKCEFTPIQKRGNSERLKRAVDSRKSSGHM